MTEQVTETTQVSAADVNAKIMASVSALVDAKTTMADLEIAARIVKTLENDGDKYIDMYATMIDKLTALAATAPTVEETPTVKEGASCTYLGIPCVKTGG